jgi:hypothetical protein
MNKAHKHNRNNFLKIWCIGFFVLFAMLLLQFFGGKYDPQAHKAWLWLIYNTISIQAIFIYNYFINSAKFLESEKTILKTTNIFLVFYFLILLFTIVLQPLIKKYTGLRPIEVLHKSNYFLIPIQLFIGFLLFIPLIKPNKVKQAILKNRLVQNEKTQKSYNTMDNLYKICCDLLKTNKVEQIFEILLPCFEKKDIDKYNMLILLHQQWITTKNEKDINIISDEAARIQFAKVTNALLNIVNELDRNA